MVTYRSILVFSILFVVLHEIAHVLGGHFVYQIKNGFAVPASDGFHFDEVPLEMRTANIASPGDNQAGGNSTKLLELDADETAFELMMMVGYELFVANTEVSELLGTTVHEPDNVPPLVERGIWDLSFYAACSAFFVIDSRRNHAKGYPSPMTRAYNLA